MKNWGVGGGGLGVVVSVLEGGDSFHLASAYVPPRDFSTPSGLTTVRRRGEQR